MTLKKPKEILAWFAKCPSDEDVKAFVTQYRNEKKQNYKPRKESGQENPELGAVKSLRSQLEQFRGEIKNNKSIPENRREAYRQALVLDEHDKAIYDQWMASRNGIGDAVASQDKTPIDIEQYLKLAETLLRSNDPYEQGLGVSMATGRRPCEVFSVTEFRASKEHPHLIGVRRLAKKDQSKFDEQWFRVPCLVPAMLVEKAFENIRRKLPAHNWFKSKSHESVESQFNDSTVRKGVDIAYTDKLSPVLEPLGYVDDKASNFRDIFGTVILHYYVEELGLKGLKTLQALKIPKSALVHEHAETSLSYLADFNVENIPLSLKLPQHKEFGKADESEFTTEPTLNFKNILSLMTDEERLALTVEIQSGKTPDEAVVFLIRQSISGRQKTISPVNSDVAFVVRSLMKYNIEADQKLLGKPVYISKSLVEQVYEAWKGVKLSPDEKAKALGGNVGKVVKGERIKVQVEGEFAATLKDHHESLGLYDERNMAVRGAEYQNIIKMVVSAISQ